MLKKRKQKKTSVFDLWVKKIRTDNKDQDVFEQKTGKFWKRSTCLK